VLTDWQAPGPAAEAGNTSIRRIRVVDSDVDLQALGEDRDGRRRQGWIAALGLRLFRDGAGRGAPRIRIEAGKKTLRPVIEDVRPPLTPPEVPCREQGRAAPKRPAFSVA